MLRKTLIVLCLSLAVSITGSIGGVQQDDQSDDSKAQMQSDFRKIPLSDREGQLALFAGLSVVFIVMVSVLFRKYKGRGRTRVSRRDFFNEGFYNADNATFTPTFFSSESSPAILVAQHNNDLRLFITNTLRLNYRVVSTSDGLEAFEKSLEIVPDLIITDRYMPGLDGSVLCRRVKTMDATSHIPIIILTPKESDLMTTEWHQFADDFMHSSFDARELLMRVHNLIAQRKSLQDYYRSQLRSFHRGEANSFPDDAFLRSALSVLGSSYMHAGFGADQLAERLHMTKLQLYRKLKALTSYAPGDFIRQFRLERAKTGLAREGASVAEVASRSGFSNLSTFSRYFKDYTGKSPVEFTESFKTSDESLVED